MAGNKSCQIISEWDFKTFVITSCKTPFSEQNVKRQKHKSAMQGSRKQPQTKCCWKKIWIWGNQSILLLTFSFLITISLAAVAQLNHFNCNLGAFHHNVIAILRVEPSPVFFELRSVINGIGAPEVKIFSPADGWFAANWLPTGDQCGA